MPTQDREKLQAHWAVGHEVKQGRFPPANSMVCDYCQEAQARDYHHHNGYSKVHRIDVVALCRDCHVSVTPYTQERALKGKETIRARGGFSHTEKAKKKIGKASSERVRDAKTKQKTSDSIKQWWQTREGKPNLLPIGCPKCKTSPLAKGLCSGCYQRWLKRGKPAL